jgi:hypothetical protein
MLGITRKSTICLFALALCWPCGSALFGDTIKLTNGYTIHGKVVDLRAGHPKVETHVMVSFSNGGWMLLQKHNIEAIAPDNTDQFELRKESGGPEE